ncbi:hypothetical protein GCM10025734_68420 [Kitasatospora paranensis]
MRRLSAALVAALTTSAISAALVATPAQAAPPTPRAAGPAAAVAPPGTDGREGPEQPPAPQERRSQALRSQALEQLNRGTLARTPQGTAPAKVRIGGDYVQLARQRTDRVFVILAQFGDQVDDTTQYQGQPRYGGTPGRGTTRSPSPAGTTPTPTGRATSAATTTSGCSSTRRPAPTPSATTTGRSPPAGTTSRAPSRTG